jgi:glycosyltransferase involved in cell wall biosynthesis
MISYPEERYEEFKEYPEKVSVCLPIYNAEKTLARCLESINGQSYQNFNLIIVDNQSTDDSYKIACEYADAHLNTVVIRNETNVGRVDNWNKCLELAVGDYIKLVMVNDILLSNCLESLAGILNEYPNIDFVSCALASKEKDDKIYITQFLQQPAIIPGKVVLMHGIFHGNVSGGPSGQMVRSELIRTKGIKFDTRFKAVCDFDFALQIFNACDSYAYTTDTLYIFDNSIDRFHTLSNQVDYCEEECRLRRKVVEEYGVKIESNLIDGIKSKIDLTYQICSERLTLEEDKTKIREIYEKAKAYFASLVPEKTSD